LGGHPVSRFRVSGLGRIRDGNSGKRLMKYITLSVISVFLLIKVARAQESELSNHYIGFIPAVLAEPYDTIDAIEVNFFPFLYELRVGKRNDFSFQIRPILNYRFYGDQSGFSQLGGTLVANTYFLYLFDEDFWLKPQLSVFYTYAYNRLDDIQTMTFGIEPGAYTDISDHFSLSLILQPGINYYPDTFSREFVEAESGLKSHFGVFVHVGYNF